MDMYGLQHPIDPLEDEGSALMSPKEEPCTDFRDEPAITFTQIAFRTEHPGNIALVIHIARHKGILATTKIRTYVFRPFSLHLFTGTEPDDIIAEGGDHELNV